MADIVDTVTLINRVVAEDEVEKLSKQYDQAYDALGKLIRQEQAAAGFSGTFSNAVKSQADAVRNLAQQVQTAGQAARSLGSGFNPRALLEFSRAAEDAQYGLAGVLNNIPGLVMALGGGAGLTGAISLAAVAATQLYKNWGNLTSGWNDGSTKTEAERMEELRKATSLTADEAERLAKADALRAKGKELQGGKSKQETKVEKAATEAINEAGNANVVRFIRATAPEMIDSQGEAARVKGEIASKQAEIDKLSKVASLDTTGATYTRIGKLQDEIKGMTTGRDSPLERARDLTAQDKASQATLAAEWGTKPLDDLIALVKKNPDKAPPGLLKDLENARQGKTRDDVEKDLKPAEREAARVKKREEREKKIAEATRTQSWKGWDEGDLTPEEREAKARFDRQVREAQKSKEFLGFDDSQLTPAELEAKRLFQEREDKVSQATRDKAWLDKSGEAREEDSLTPEQLEAKRRSEKEDRERAKELAAAQKSRSFMGKTSSEMTVAEREAKRLHDEQEVAIAESRASLSFEGKDNEDLTPAEAIAKRRHNEDERKRKERATEASRVATERRREQTKAPGLDDYIRDAIIQGASDVDLDKQLHALGIDAKGRNELISEGTRNAYGKRLADMEDAGNRQSQVFTSGAQLRDSIQAGVKGEDLLGQQLKRLESIEGVLRSIDGKDNIATFG